MDQLQDRKVIAERSLLYSPKGKKQLQEFRICVYEPYLLTREAANYRFGAQDLYVCEVKTDGLNLEVSHETHASDTIRAIHMATGAVDFLVRQIMKKGDVDVFWADGDPYFDDRDS